MRKVLKIVGITLGITLIIIFILLLVLLVKNKIDMKKSWLDNEYYTQFQSNEEMEIKYAKLGEYDVSETDFQIDDKNIKNIRIWYPSDLNEHKYPVILVANASNMASLNYKPFFQRLASWGFIVVGNDDRQTGTGQSISKTLDYILNLNADKENIFFNKIDKENIGIVGYSQGGAGAIRAVTEFENSHYFKAIFTGSAAYPLLAKNMGWKYDTSKINIPYFMTAGTGTSDDNGKYNENEFSGVSPLFALQNSYDSINNAIFKIRARVTGAEHEDMQIKTDGYMTAWFLYHLQNENEAGSIFLGDNAKILNNKNWQDIEKNK